MPRRRHTPNRIPAGRNPRTRYKLDSAVFGVPARVLLCARGTRIDAQEETMPLSGKGMLITLMDADPAEEQDFNKWYDKEHIIERAGYKTITETVQVTANCPVRKRYTLLPE